jgi:hypothetical protein
VGIAVAAGSGLMVHVLWNQLSILFYAQQELDQSANSICRPIQSDAVTAAAFPMSVVYALFLGISSFLCAVSCKTVVWTRSVHHTHLPAVRAAVTIDQSLTMYNCYCGTAAAPSAVGH